MQGTSCARHHGGTVACLFCYDLFEFRNVGPTDIKIQIVVNQDTSFSANKTCRTSEVRVTKAAEIAARSKYHRIRWQFTDQLVN